MTTAKLAAYIGKYGSARLGASSSSKERVLVDVEVIDARSAFGRTDLLIRPLAGSGEAWVSEETVTLWNEEG